ncbi:flagellar hook protein FlgE [uncultured Selenomonas sp.]|uniref:flagellar hook protein FlgE n=1 Tax=uncultured Selenomonas sp. TaxID=159275 RepID=UPI002805F882|nr:flagellar hook protein FlgE [uncultured Selenomonas sp.]
MMRSLFSGVSGLKSHQTRMDVIGNNIANVNTTGFKSSRTTFADTLSQTLSGASSPQDEIGGTNPKQIGLGTGVASIDLLFTDGSVQSTGKNTDLCLSGNGLFVVKRGSETYYTRDGAFEFDAEGNYVLPSSGLYVQGWTATDGVLNTSGAAGNIKIAAGKSMAAKATAKATYANNLNAGAPTISSITDGKTTYDAKTTGSLTASTTTPVTITLSDGSTVTETTGKYTVGQSLPVTTTLTVYDALGNAHSVPVYFTKTTTDSTNGNTWTVSINTDDSGTSSIKESDGTTTTIAMANQELKFTTDGKYKSGSGTVVLTLKNGATGTQNVTLDLSKLTQYSGKSTVNGTPDGNAAGTLSSVSVDSSGIITGTYTNGVKQTEAQVAVAQFTNASGLTKTGNSLYQESNNSGTANVKTAADLGVTITPSALEMSNVDIANEFSDMIITQRGFQSNSKIITVGDEMLETLINMKR